MTLIAKPTHDPKLTRWWWRTLREWIYELVNPLWAAFRGENSDEVAFANIIGINEVSASELAILSGLTTSTTELNTLTGLTAGTDELNKADRGQADGAAEASKNVVLDSNKDLLGKRYDINQSLLESITGQPNLHFDGNNDYAYVEDDDNLDFGTGNFTVMGTFKLNQPLSSGYHYFLSKECYWLRFQTYSAGDLGFGVNSKVANQPDGAFDTYFGKWVHIAGVRSGDNLYLYLNGEQIALETGAAGETASGTQRLNWAKYNNSSGIGALPYSNLAVRIFNRALSADEIKIFASGALPDFADAGAGQADMVTNGEDWSGASGTTPPNDWSDTGAGTATYIIRDNSGIANFGDDKALELSVSGGSKTLYQSIAQAGKRYRLSFVYRNLDGSSSSYVTLGSESNEVTLQNTGISGDGVVFEQELEADETDLKFFVDSGGTLQMDHVKVVQIGCVAEYLPDGITHAQWQDTSGNELHGTVNGAVLLSLPSNYVARYIKPSITGDTTLSSVIPGGYRIKSMVADVTGASSGMILNLGTTSGGSDVVNGQDISSNGLFDLTVAKNIFSLNDAQSLYVNDDGGTAWSGVSVDLYIVFERIK